MARGKGSSAFIKRYPSGEWNFGSRTCRRLGGKAQSIACLHRTRIDAWTATGISRVILVGIGKAALVGGHAGFKSRNKARTDSGTAGKRNHGLRWPAVVAKGRKTRSCAYDITIARKEET